MGFPGVDRVHFDTTMKDLIVSGKPRTSYGKGLRAIMQSAFTISLLQYCADNDLAHPGIVVLDSPAFLPRAGGSRRRSERYEPERKLL